MSADAGDQQQRVTVRCSSYNVFDADIGGSTRSVFDDERSDSSLPVEQPLTYDARNSVGPAAGRNSDGDVYRPRRVGLRPRNARHRGKVRPPLQPDRINAAGEALAPSRPMAALTARFSSTGYISRALCTCRGPCPLLAQSGHCHRADRCLLSGVKQTSAAGYLECALAGGQFSCGDFDSVPGVVILELCWA